MIANIQNYIEQTYLSPFLTAETVEKAIAEAKQYGFVGLCLPPYWVKKARRDLGFDSPTALVTVIGFPLGYHKSEVKLQELKSAIKDGADELDVMLNLSAIKTGAYHWVKIEVAQLAQIAHESEKIIKVILETASLTDEEIINTAKVCTEAGVDFLKTSTGFGEGGADLDDIKLLRKVAPQNVGIKASGGIRTFQKAKEFIEAGAERIGTSAGVTILKQAFASEG